MLVAGCHISACFRQTAFRTQSHQPTTENQAKPTDTDAKLASYVVCTFATEHPL
jgi:hypothetical protein